MQTHPPSMNVSSAYSPVGRASNFEPERSVWPGPVPNSCHSWPATSLAMPEARSDKAPAASPIPPLNLSNPTELSSGRACDARQRSKGLACEREADVQLEQPPTNIISVTRVQRPNMLGCISSSNQFPGFLPW